MGKKFEETFSSPVRFYPKGWHISRTNLSVEEAAEKFNSEGCEKYDVKPENLKESWVRYQLCNDDMMGLNSCWMEISKRIKSAQPTWSILTGL